MPGPSFVVGIDLGTTHCAVAAAPLQRPSVHVLGVPQLVGPGEVAERTLLPSFLYLPAAGELDPGELRLPWGEAPQVVGELARRLGAKTPNRLVASAKSWVCHGGVNRRAPILPWNSPEDQPHVSPHAAQVAYLAHLRASWDARHPSAPLHEQDVVVTVPASFDEGARELTSSAAREAGLGEVRLLEEPQAAFYDFFGSHHERLDALLGDARLVLVVDVGGGTTDLTLLRVRAAEEVERDEAKQRIERIAVGGHLMLGGDNMDAALAMFALEKTGAQRPRDATVWSAMVQSAREVKELLLGPEPPEVGYITFQARGSRLVGGTRSIEIKREEARAVLLDGFLPLTARDAVAERTGRAGLTTLGLPYTTDTAIGRHVCAFLRRHVQAAQEAGALVVDGLPRPDRVLLNGGVFNASALVARLQELLVHWYGEPVGLLDHTSLETAVARGAVRSALARRGVGEVIGGGTARAYYIGVEGAGGQPEALCVAPRAMEEGASVDVPGRTFELVVDRPVLFPLFAYTGDRLDRAGDLVPLDDELEPLAPLETVLRRKDQAVQGDTVPVSLSCSLTSGGALELYLVTALLPPRRWKLDFSLWKSADEGPASADEETEAPELALHTRWAEARARFLPAFGQREGKQVKGIRRDLETILGPRGQWSGATCRAIFDLCLERRDDRARTDEHELQWLRLCGWGLRPGFGMPGDEDRIEAMERVRLEGLRKPTKANWAEWWIALRRIAAGLSAPQQLAVFESVRPWLWREGKPPPGPHAHGQVEMLQLLAALERLPAEHKERAGDLCLARADKIGSYWPMARLGARVPLHADGGDVVPIAVAERWLQAVEGLDWDAAEGAGFAAASMVRSTGDPALDLSPALRETVVERLRRTNAPASWLDLALGRALAESDAKRMFGDSLPVGLRLR